MFFPLFGFLLLLTNSCLASRNKFWLFIYRFVLVWKAITLQYWLPGKIKISKAQNWADDQFKERMCFWSLRTIFGPTWTPTCQLPRLGGAPHIIKYQYHISNIEYQISSLPTPSFRWTSKYHPTIVKNWEVTFTFAQQKQINIKIKTIDSSPEIHTPNLDELAATSAVFNRAYVQVVQKPMCLCAGKYKSASTPQV